MRYFEKKSENIVINLIGALWLQKLFSFLALQYNYEADD